MNYIIANHIHINFQYDSYHIHLTNTIFTHIDTDGSVVLSCLSGMEKKRGLQVQDICIGSKMTITIIDLDIVPFAIPLQLKTGPVERRNLGVLVGDVVSELCTTAPRLLLKQAASETRDSSIYYEQRRSLCQVRTKYKCKSVIVIYPGPTSTQP